MTPRECFPKCQTPQHNKLLECRHLKNADPRQASRHVEFTNPIHTSRHLKIANPTQTSRHLPPTPNGNSRHLKIANAIRTSEHLEKSTATQTSRHLTASPQNESDRTSEPLCKQASVSTHQHNLDYNGQNKYISSKCKPHQRCTVGQRTHNFQISKKHMQRAQRPERTPAKAFASSRG